MVKKILIFFALFICTLILPFNLKAYDDLSFEEDEPGIETSIVLLNITVEDITTASDPFFEIMDFYEENYILIPLNLLSAHVNLDMELYRGSSTLIVNNLENNRSVTVDLKTKTYVNHENWSSEPPVVLEGDFFVSPQMLAYLFDIEINWDRSLQELLLRGNYFKQDESLSIEDKKEEIIDEDIILEENLDREEYQKKTEDFSLGSIHCEIGFDYYNDSSGREKITANQNINIFGRFRDWSFDLGESVNYNINTKEINRRLDLLRIKRKKNDKLFLLGDFKMDFENTLGSLESRGLYFRYPENFSFKLITYTSVDGTVEEASEVSLYVNDEFIKKINVEEGRRYEFNNVRLKTNRLNVIKVIIENNSEKKEITKKVAASPNVLKEGTREIEAGTGLYSRENISEWQGKMAGVKTSSSLTENISLYLETVFNKENEGCELFASNLGLVGRHENSVLSVDWLKAGNSNGGEMSYLYALESGYLKTLVNYIPPEVEEAVLKKDQGREINMRGAFDLSSKWTVNPSAGNYRSLDNDFNYKRDYTQMFFSKHEGWGNYISVGGRYENILSDYTRIVDNNQIIIPGTNNRYGITGEIQRQGNGFKGGAKISIFDNNIELADGEENKYQEIKAKFNLYKNISSSLLIQNNTELSANRYNKNIKNINYETDTKLKFLIGNNTGLTAGISKSNMPAGNQESYSLKLKRYFENTNLNIGISDKRSSSTFDYRALNLGIAYHPKLNESISLYYDFLLPENSLLNQHNYGVKYNKLLNEDRELEITAGKNHVSLLSDKNEKYFTFSISQAFGFAGDKVLPQSFNDSRHDSFVAGHVYLDENNNGKMDPGERKLPNIKMQLDNIRVETDENGFYKFNPYAAGTYSLNFDYSNLHADYTPVTKEQIITVEENKNIFKNYALTINGSISGKVFLDKNNNGKFDEDEELLSWIGISLNSGEKIKYTDRRGEFHFENLPLGTYEINVLTDSLPSILKPSIESNKIKIIEADLDKDEILIPLVFN